MRLNARLVARRPRMRWRALLQWAVVLAGVGFLIWQIPDLSTDANRLGGQLAHLRWGYVGVAAVLGVGALWLYGELRRLLLIVGQAPLPVRTVQAINFAENALSTTLPAVGNAAGFAYAIYQLRKRGVHIAVASWSVVLPGIVSTIVLVVLGVLGLGWGGQMPVVAAAAIAAALALAAATCWTVLTRPAVLWRSLRFLVGLGQRTPGFCRMCRRGWTADPDAVAQRVSARIQLLRPTWIQWVGIVGLAAASWTLDFLSLSASIAATRQPIPWPVLVVGFLVVQATILLQLFPGGAGLAEAGLLGVLIASGVPLAAAMASVLVYRLINWLGLALIGWVVYAAQIHTAPAYRHHHAESVGGAPHPRRPLRNRLRVRALRSPD